MACILVVGGAHVDREGRLFAPHIAGASNPGRWETHPGGGAFNAARNLARLGHQVTLVSPRGGDAAGEMVAAAAIDAGIEDCPITFLDRATPSYSAILEPDGNLVTALADMQLYDMVPARRLATWRFRARLDAADVLLMDANMPADTLTLLAEAARARGLVSAGIAISPAKIVRYSAALADLDFLFMNRNEARALTGRSEPGDGGWPEALRAKGLAGGAVTAGGEAVTVFTGAGTLTLEPPPLSNIADVTGAGDALAAGFLDAHLSGAGLSAALSRGIALARLTAGVRGPVRNDLTPALLAEAGAAFTG